MMVHSMPGFTRSPLANALDRAHARASAHARLLSKSRQSYPLKAGCDIMSFRLFVVIFQAVSAKLIVFELQGFTCSQTSPNPLHAHSEAKNHQNQHAIEGPPEPTCPSPSQFDCDFLIWRWHGEGPRGEVSK
jgi:hypothetical protein